MHMGTTLGLSLQNPTGHASYGWQSKPFSKWFSWCQSCRHGGHTEHLTQWFSQHLECPVASCTCRCFTLDFSIPETNKETAFWMSHIFLYFVCNAPTLLSDWRFNGYEQIEQCVQSINVIRLTLRNANWNIEDSTHQFNVKFQRTIKVSVRKSQLIQHSLHFWRPFGH